MMTIDIKDPIWISLNKYRAMHRAVKARLHRDCTFLTLSHLDTRSPLDTPVVCAVIAKFGKGQRRYDFDNLVLKPYLDALESAGLVPSDSPVHIPAGLRIITRGPRPVLSLLLFEQGDGEHLTQWVSTNISCLL